MLERYSYQQRQFPLLLCFRRGAKYCDEYVCVCVCVSVREDISETKRAIFSIIIVHVAHSRGLVLLRRRCDTLCTSYFADDIMYFSYNGPYSYFVTKDQFRSNLLIYRKVGHNSISNY